jgi:chromate transport protein ChrA
MNPVLVVVAVLIAIVFAAGSYIGRKHSEWKNMLRILVGVGAFMGVVNLILRSSSTWVILGSLLTLCVGLFIANICKQTKMGPVQLLRALFASKSKA